MSDVKTLTKQQRARLEINEHRCAVLNAHADLGYPEWGNGPVTEWPRKARGHIESLRAEVERLTRERDRYQREAMAAREVAALIPSHDNGYCPACHADIVRQIPPPHRTDCVFGAYRAVRAENEKREDNL